MSDQLGALLASEQTVGGTWFPFTVCSQMAEKRDKLKKKSELEELENSQPVYTSKNEKEIMGFTEGSDPPWPRQPGIERSLSREDPGRASRLTAGSHQTSQVL